jgi:adenosylhomocysteine nucleosidase
MTNPTLTILCPMKMEAAKFTRLARRYGWTLITTGIGAGAIEHALATGPQTGPVLLAGIAGALRRDLKAGTAHLISEVYTSQAILHSPIIRTGLRVTGADEIVATPEDKVRLAERTGAHVVDMESHAFALAAERAGRSWAIIRGVSDGVDHHLPAGCDAWFTPQGGLRPFIAARSLAGRPKELLQMIAFARRTSLAMKSVARLAEETFVDNSGYAAT